MAKDYSDIIGLEHHTSERHPRMSLHDRAAQFSPFAALTGHEAAIMEAQRLTEQFREPDENMKAMLDGKLQLLQEEKEQKPEVTVVHFVPDLRKEGGAYVETPGTFLKVDGNERMVILEEGKKIPLERIWDIYSNIFGDM